MVDRDESDPACIAIRDVLGQVGDKWSSLVIAALGPGTRRFNELRREVDGISQRMLTVTLRHLERDGLISRRIYAEIPPRVEYTLTELGESLLKVVTELVRWSMDHAWDLHQARAAFDGAGVISTLQSSDNGYGAEAQASAAVQSSHLRVPVE
jgi:DNA-binding HxlR family transcriptional regulator